MRGTTCYQGNREVMLNRAKRYYHDNIKVLREKAKNKYRELSEEEKKLKSDYMKETDIIMCLKKKSKPKRISKNYCEAKKSLSKM